MPKGYRIPAILTAATKTTSRIATIIATIAFAATLITTVPITTIAPTKAAPKDAPKAPVKNVSEEYHGKTVTDPYRYMEDLENEEVKTWIKAQADYTTNTLKNLPVRDQLLQRLKELDQGTPYVVYRFRPQPDGDLLYLKRMADEEVAKLIWLSGETGEEKVLIDPTTEKSEDGQPPRD